MSRCIIIETLSVVGANDAYCYTVNKKSPLIRAMIANSEQLPKPGLRLSHLPKVTFAPEIPALFGVEWEAADFGGRVGLFLLAMDNFDQALIRSVSCSLRSLHHSVPRFIHEHESEIQRHRLGNVDG